MKLLKHFFALATLLFIATSMINAQTTGSISGTVFDSTGETLAGATVKVTHVPSGTNYYAISQSNGRYTINGVRVGQDFAVEFSFIGFTTHRIENVTVTLGDPTILDVTLQADSFMLSEVVVVSNYVLGHGRTGVATSVSNADLQRLPTINRSVTDFTRITPQAGNSGSFAGRDTRYNSISIDGAQFQARFGLSTSNNLPGGDAQPIALDAIQEISVNISPFDVRQSGFTGATVNAVTRSGDNNFTGSAYTYLRPKSFTGEKIGDRYNIRTINGARESSKQIYGGTFGGAIVQNKLFFFLSGEYENTNRPGINWRPSTDGVADAANNISRTTIADMQRVAEHLKNVYGYDPMGYTDFRNFESKNYKIMARIDWNINDNHKMMIRYNDVKSNNDIPTNASSGPALGVNGHTFIASNRISADAIAFESAWYGMENKVRSITTELNSKFSDMVSNKLLVTYTRIQDTRTTPNSNPFPFVDILEGNRRYMSFGTELFSYNNEVINNNFVVTNNTSFSLNNHFLTAGVSYENQYFSNGFMREGTTYYAYNSVDDFINNERPRVFAYQLGYPGNEVPVAEVRFGTLSAYLQDEWNVNSRLKITAGVRVEQPFYLSDLGEQPQFNPGTGNVSLNSIEWYNGIKIDQTAWPAAKPTFSPRIGFNYDVKGDRSIVVRGGTGIFAGLPPFVWFTNQPASAGWIQTPEIVNQPMPADFRFNPNFREAVFGASSGITPPTQGQIPSGAALAVVDKDLKLPSVWRSSLATDIKLPANFVFTIEGLYTRDVVNLIQQNIHLEEAGKYNGIDNRTYMRRMYSTIGSNTMLTNGETMGYSTSLTFQLTKQFSNGFAGMIAYTYNDAKDLAANPGSTANSAFTASANVGNPNTPALSWSAFSMPHRVNGYVSYSANWLRNATSTFSLFYNGTNQGRLQYIFTAAPEGGINTTRALIYVPKDKSEMRFIDRGTFTVAQQEDVFETFIQSNKYLNSRRGQYAERYGDVQPWVNRFDFKYVQDIFTTFGTDRRYTLQFTFDIINAANLLNSSWGCYYSNSILNFENMELLIPTVVDNEIFYQLNATSADNFRTRTTWFETVNIASSWGMQMGFRIRF